MAAGGMPWQLAGQLTVEAGSCRENELPCFAFWFTDEELERATTRGMHMLGTFGRKGDQKIQPTAKETFDKVRPKRRDKTTAGLDRPDGINKPDKLAPGDQVMQGGFGIELGIKLGGFGIELGIKLGGFGIKLGIKLD
ncbi:MAG TPA: hypothetical protein EYP98_13640, partial [Planctomycetes bacterium]|nr:hypothetical protein [Planctomycetota bacterium]